MYAVDGDNLMGKKGWLLLLLFVPALSGCMSDGGTFSGPDPAPRDVASPAELSPELASVRIPQREGEGEDEKGYFMRLDQSNPIAAEGCSSLSPSDRFLACLPNLGLETVELVDLRTGERRVLVRKEESFPDAVLFGYPSFTPEEDAVIFDVAWSDHSNLAIVDIESGEIEYLDVPGIMNIEPRVSSDGNLVMESCEGTQPGAGFVLCLFDMSTRSRRYLVNERINVIPGSRFTADGQSVVYSAPVGGIAGEGHIHHVDVESGEKRVLVSGLNSADIVLGATSEDVVFSCRFPERPLCSWICVIGLDGNDPRRLTYFGESCIDPNSP
jgi:hypothetical protein